MLKRIEKCKFFKVKKYLVFGLIYGVCCKSNTCQVWSVSTLVYKGLTSQKTNMNTYSNNSDRIKDARALQLKIN